jgi:adiponectin receptor
MILGALFCLSCSTIYHLFSCHCENTYHILNRIDYAGISILIAGSCYPPYTYFFYCSNCKMIINIVYSIFYVTFITIFAVIVFACSLKADFNSPKKRSLRGVLFLLLGVSTAAPLIHLVFFCNYTKGLVLYPTLHNWIIGGFFYIMGVCIYICRFPEKHWPGTFDYGVYLIHNLGE